MHSGYTIFTVTLVLFFCSAGCLSPDGMNMNHRNTATDPLSNLETISLSEGNAPPNFTLVESRQKNEDEVSDLALSLGWRGGHIVRFERTEDPDREPTSVSQSIALYPEDRMLDIMNYVQQTEKREKPYMIVDLPNPGIGDFSCATAAYKIVGENATTLSNIQTLDTEYYEIIFTKGPVFEVLRINGPSADYSTLLDLARTAYKKV